MDSFFSNRSLRLKSPHEKHLHWQSLDRCFKSKQHSVACVFSQHSTLGSLWLQQRHSVPNVYERDIRSQLTEKINVISLDFLKMVIDLIYIIIAYHYNNILYMICQVYQE